MNKEIKSKYDVDDIYEWKIEGVSEYQILNILQEMIMASTAYNAKGNTDHLISRHLIVGFIGQLKGWWDNVLTKEEKKVVQTSLDERGNQNSMHTLIYAIAKHFLREPMVFQERGLEILQNLRCRKLEDFRCYKDVYLSKLYTMIDANQPFWKERFLHGLPKTLAKRVQMRIKKKYNWIIPYDFLTYGESINFINKEALHLCSLIKVNATIKKDLRT